MQRVNAIACQCIAQLREQLSGLTLLNAILSMFDLMQARYTSLSSLKQLERYNLCFMQSDIWRSGVHRLVPTIYESIMASESSDRCS